MKRSERQISALAQWTPPRTSGEGGNIFDEGFNRRDSARPGPRRTLTGPQRPETNPYTMPKRMPDRMSGDMPDRMSEDLPDRMSEDVPDRYAR